jgi:hypothetical protein
MSRPAFARFEEVPMAQAGDDRVQCRTCGAVFEAIPGLEKSEQAHGCASTVQGSSIVGSYGSAVIDMERWEFRGPRPERVRDGAICDPCVAALRMSGAIELAETGVL